ncbi:MAG: DUF4469 domain-containing protein [Spirochaetales bacterium]|nr:DUF4469 domain-containing protein [Spirochaetales bacterium]
MLLDYMEFNTAIRKEDHRLSIAQFAKGIEYYVARGMTVKTPFGTFKPSIRGSFENLDEDFRPGASTNNHRFKVLFRPYKDFVSNIIKNLQAERVHENALKYPAVINIENMSKPADNKMHRNDLLIFQGLNLKYDEAALDEGIFWVGEDDTPVRTEIISVNTAKKLHFLIPALGTGEYSVEVATRLGNHKLRRASLDETFTIV